MATPSTSQFLDMASYMDLDKFLQYGILNDAMGRNGRSNGILRLNRFVGVLNLLDLHKKFNWMYHNNEITGGGWGDTFLAWDIFKIDCPAFRLEVDSREVDMRPRYSVKNWVHDDLSVSFLESSDLKIRHFFFEWMESALTATNYRRSYYNDVCAPWFHVYPLNFQGQAERYEVFRELLPFEVSSINYDVSDNGEQIALTTVKFKYTSHELLSLPSNK